MNKLFAIIISAILTLPVSVWAVEDAVSVDESAPIVNTLDEDIDEAVQEETLVQDDIQESFKQPISKRKIAKKFLAAMGGVAVSSFAIFFLLTAYNRIRDGFKGQVRTLEGETSLETPNDLNSAVKTFLEKTNW